MWIVTAHQVAGTAAEQFGDRDAALQRVEELLSQNVTVTVDPTGQGLPVARWCSFCGKSQTAVLGLVAGPSGVAICNECIALADKIVPNSPR